MRHDNSKDHGWASALRRLLVIAMLLLATSLLAVCGDDDEATPSQPTCTLGQEGCACTTAGTCDATDADGNALGCSANVCVECTAGDTGCACAAGGLCSDPSDECSEQNICRPATDCTGEVGCECYPDNTCDGALTCIGGLCTVENGVFISLSGGDARACDLLITADRNVDDVVFVAGVRGRMRTRNETTALALIRTEDTALSGVVATVVFEGSDEATADDISSVAATCYDRLGQSDDGVTAEVQ